MVIRARGSSADSLFDFVLGCKLSPLPRHRYGARRCLIAHSYGLSNGSRAPAGGVGDTVCCWVSTRDGVGHPRPGATLSLPLSSYCNNEQEEFFQVFLKEKRNLPVVSDKADPVKSQIGMLEISVLS